MDMSLSVEQRVALLHQDVSELRIDLEEAVHFIKGNGDPTKGLMWVVADQARLIATITQMMEAHRLLIEKQKSEADMRYESHVLTAHRADREDFWTKAKDAAIRQTVTGAVILTMTLLGLGIIRFVQSIPIAPR